MDLKLVEFIIGSLGFGGLTVWILWTLFNKLADKLDKVPEQMKEDREAVVAMVERLFGTFRADQRELVASYQGLLTKLTTLVNESIVHSKSLERTVQDQGRGMQDQARAFEAMERAIENQGRLIEKTTADQQRLWESVKAIMERIAELPARRPPQKPQNGA